ncbi:MAG: undecaprenyl/decaprenyl-phosphate alpha-N-acetylglucosaminyl 1-phosphate transferase [Nitrospirae bacterium]|nr:undecaprenyl/decaprenyl-phosphate alpha-N-acetylglucosaminyl 1-phosphate transferase [Nitrospirota bacterium]
MQLIDKSYIYFLIPFLLTLFVTPVVIRLAVRFDCIDKPGKRRIHKYPTPRWGGIAFFIGILPVFLFLQIDRQIAAYLTASLLLITMGGIDDWRQVGWKVKFLGIITAITIVIFGGGVVINSIGTYGSYGKVELGILSIPFTYLGIAGVTNAINLIDGLHGLAGGVSLIAFIFIGIAAYLSGNYMLAVISLAFVGALGGFLWYNFPKARIFIGDSGSLFLGFSLAVFSVFLTQNAKFPIEPMFPVLVLFIPIFDTLRVVFVRVFSIKNPFKADKTHVHHLLVRRGVSPVSAVIFLWTLSAFLGGYAILLIRRTSTSYLVVTLLVSLLFSFFADSLVRRRQ